MTYVIKERTAAVPVRARFPMAATGGVAVVITRAGCQWAELRSVAQQRGHRRRSAHTDSTTERVMLELGARCSARRSRRSTHDKLGGKRAFRGRRCPLQQRQYV